MDSEPVKAFNAELTSILESRPPLTKKKIQEISKAALKGIKYYKHIVFSVEKFLAKCHPDYKIPCLYIIDAIIRQSKHQFKQKDVFGSRFQKNFHETLDKLMNCPEDDKPKITRTLNLWITHDVYPREVIEGFLKHCKNRGIETDVAAVEKMVKGDKANMSIYEAGGKKREKDKEKERQPSSSKSRSHTRFEAATPPGPPPESRPEPSDETPEDGISERTLLNLMKKAGIDFGGLFSADLTLLKRFHATTILPKLRERIQRLHEERGDNIKQILTRDFEYSDDEDNVEEPPKRLSQHEIDSLAEQSLRDPTVLRALHELNAEKVAAFSKVALEAKQRNAVQHLQLPPGMSGLPTGVPPPVVPGIARVPVSLSGLPPGVQLPPGLPGLPGLGQHGLPLNPALVNLLSGNPLLMAAQAGAGLPLGLPPLPQGLSQGIPPNMAPPVSGVPPPVSIPGFTPNRPPPMMPNIANLQNIQHMVQQQQQAVAAANALVQQQQHQQMQQQNENELRTTMEQAIEHEAMQQHNRDREERDRRERERRRDDREGKERDRDRDPRDRRRSRSRDRERRDRDRDRDSGRRRRSRSRDREQRGARDPRDPREGQKSLEHERPEDREKERERRKIGLPSVPKAEHLTVASCTLWFGRLPANCSEEEIRESIKEVGQPTRVSVVGSKACAYVTMPDRKSAFKVVDKYEKTLSIRGRQAKLSWGVGPGLKNAQDQFGDYWESSRGLSQIPWSRLPPTLGALAEGSWIDIGTLPPSLRGNVNEFGRNPNEPSLPNANDISQIPAPALPHAMPPFMVPPPGMPPFGVPPPQMGSVGPHTPTKPPPEEMQAAFNSMIGAPGFPPPMMPPGLDPQGGSGYGRSGFGGSFRGGFQQRGGFRGSPRGGGFRGGHQRGGWQARGGFTGGMPHMGFPPPEAAVRRHDGPPGISPPPMNDDSEVSSTVNDDVAFAAMSAGGDADIKPMAATDSNQKPADAEIDAMEV